MVEEGAAWVREWPKLSDSPFSLVVSLASYNGAPAQGHRRSEARKPIVTGAKLVLS